MVFPSFTSAKSRLTVWPSVSCLYSSLSGFFSFPGWTLEEKLELVLKVLSGHSNKSVALEADISDGMLYQWVRKYKIWGYTGLVDMKKGRPPKEPKMKHTEINTLAPLTESEREELIRLRAEIEYIKAENEVIKKEIALREEKQAALLKAKKQQSSKNFEKKDIS